MSPFWNRMAVSFAMIVNGVGCGKAIESGQWPMAVVQGAAALAMLVVLHFASIVAAAAKDQRA